MFRTFGEIKGNEESSFDKTAGVGCVKQCSNTACRERIPSLLTSHIVQCGVGAYDIPRAKQRVNCQ